MTAKKLTVTDLLFGVQIGCTLWFGGSQFLELITGSKSASLSWYGFWEAFLILNLVLASEAHQKLGNRDSFQALWSYRVWAFVVAADLGAIFWKSKVLWDSYDTLTTIIAGCGIAATLFVASRMNLGVIDPLVRGHFALWFKAVPQFILAYKMLCGVDVPLAWGAVIAGHVTILIRLWLLRQAVREKGWIRSVKGMALSEIANEVSWTAATVVWLIY